MDHRGKAPPDGVASGHLERSKAVVGDGNKHATPAANKGQGCARPGRSLRRIGAAAQTCPRRHTMFINGFTLSPCTRMDTATTISVSCINCSASGSGNPCWIAYIR